MIRAWLVLPALVSFGCRSECERALEERAGLELPSDAEFSKCEYQDVTQLKDRYRIEAEFRSKASFSELAQTWDLQEAGFEAGKWFLLAESVGLAPGQRGDRPDAVKDSAMRIRNRRLVALRRLGSSRYLLKVENTPVTEETTRRVPTPDANSGP